MEAVIRAALGDPDTDLTGIRRSELLNIRAVISAVASDVLSLDVRAINDLVVRAEKIAVVRGFHPPLVR